jgi:4-hydroxy-2-oxoheptanedioate aldolase
MQFKVANNHSICKFGSNDTIMSNLKERLKTGDAVHGCWLNMGSAIASEIVGSAGFDWILFDLEHGAGAESTLLPQLQPLGNSDTVPLVRVESYEPARVKRVLDAGIKGIMFPQIQNADEAREAIANMYYPPIGRRGMAKMVRAAQYGMDFENYKEFATKGLLGIIQIETIESLNHLDEIAAIEGVDVLFLGPADLSLALGIFGQWDHPDFVKAVKAIGDAARNAGKAAGTIFFDLDQYDYFYQSGFRFLASGSDMTFLSKGAYAMVKDLNNQREKYQ